LTGVFWQGKRNFDKVRGVSAKNVSIVKFGPNGSISVEGIGAGLPGIRPTVVYPRSASQIFIGGMDKNHSTMVYEWRKSRATPWGRLGKPGLGGYQSQDPLGRDIKDVKGLIVVN